MSALYTHCRSTAILISYRGRASASALASLPLLTAGLSLDSHCEVYLVRTPSPRYTFTFTLTCFVLPVCTTSVTQHGSPANMSARQSLRVLRELKSKTKSTAVTLTRLAVHCRPEVSRSFPGLHRTVLGSPTCDRLRSTGSGSPRQCS